MFPAEGWTSDLKRLCSVRNSRRSALLSDVGGLSWFVRVGSDRRFFPTTAVTAADKTIRRIKFDVCIALQAIASRVKIDSEETVRVRMHKHRKFYNRIESNSENIYIYPTVWGCNW